MRISLNKKIILLYLLCMLFVSTGCQRLTSNQSSTPRENSVILSQQPLVRGLFVTVLQEPQAERLGPALGVDVPKVGAIQST